MTPRAPAGVGWPGWPHLRHFARLAALLTVWFAVVFCGADWITARHSLRIHAYTQGELAIALIPVMVVPYMTMYLIFYLAPFVLRSRADLDRLAGALARVIAIAGVAFVAFPAELGFPPVDAPGSVWNSWLHLADRLNLDYDLVPSLHVALFTVCAGTYAARASSTARALLAVWLVVVAASTVLTHQHQLLDVVTGLALGAWGARAALVSKYPQAPRAAPTSVLNLEGQ
ncbi:MAG TPA: phosphatase PAP2 family protein [Steroidobacteraceae bacterium]|nr:phosphatase PAP2 family protein [Steroidobacteraceae bacterium]